jgi:hypothetical protein
VAAVNKVTFQHKLTKTYELYSPLDLIASEENSNKNLKSLGYKDREAIILAKVTTTLKINSSTSNVTASPLSDKLSSDQRHLTFIRRNLTIGFFYSSNKFKSVFLKISLL